MIVTPSKTGIVNANLRATYIQSFTSLLKNVLLKNRVSNSYSKCSTMYRASYYDTNHLPSLSLTCNLLVDNTKCVMLFHALNLQCHNTFAAFERYLVRLPLPLLNYQDHRIEILSNWRDNILLHHARKDEQNCADQNNLHPIQA